MDIVSAQLLVSDALRLQKQHGPFSVGAKLALCKGPGPHGQNTCS